MSTFSFNKVSVTRSSSSSAQSINVSGTTSDAAEYDLKNTYGTISASVTGGYGWLSSTDSGGGDRETDSLRVEMTVKIYKKKSDGTLSLLTSATGSAEKGGSLQLYDHATSASCSYNMSNMSDADWLAYDKIRIEYSVVAKDAYNRERYTGYTNKKGSGGIDNYDTGSPSGSATINVRDNINVKMDGTTMKALNYSGRIRRLNYNGSQIF